MSKAATDTLQKVASEFQEEVLADLRGGVAQAQALIDSARAEATEGVAKTIETGVKQAESIKRQIAGAAELEVRNGQLRSLERAVNDVFEAAVNEISKTHGAKVDKSLAMLIKEGLEVIGPKAKVQCNSRDRRTVSSLAKKLSTGHVRLSVDDKAIDTIGGVVMTTPDGLVKFDNTFEARLERMKQDLRKGVADLLTAS